MKFFVLAKPNSKTSFVKKSDDSFIVAVKEPPIQGRANQAVIEALAEYFKVSQNQIKIIAGQASKRKIVEIK